jgi:hypothetical protein
MWPALLALSLTSPAAGQSDAAADRVRILFIGNSYTYVNDLPRTLQAMAAAGGSHSVEVGSVLVGGASLRRHWNDRDAVELVRRAGWDYVVLQEQSLLPLENPDELIAYGKRFGTEIRAAQATPVLYLTWARKGRPSSAQDSLDRAYLRLAGEIGATIVPVGPAWREFQRLEPTSDLYAEDGSHPSPLGSFVAASVFYRTLFGRPPPASYAGSLPLTPRTRTAVQRAVGAAVSRFHSANSR